MIGTQKKTILVVDDDPVVTKMLDSILTESGYTVLVATEAADGLQKAMTRSPDLVVLDVMMPIINGYNFCRLLKSDEKRKKTPVVFLTSRDAKEDKAIGHEMGANAYLTKPLDTQLFLSNIRQLLG